jgi:Flp pilus assembly pilin Flp
MTRVVHPNPNEEERNIMKSLLNDENGFVVSAELILVATIVVLGLVVALAEVRQAVSEELEDVASAIGSINQSYTYSGLKAKWNCISGSHFYDDKDLCDSQFDVVGIPSIGEDD